MAVVVFELVNTLPEGAFRHVRSLVDACQATSIAKVSKPGATGIVAKATPVKCGWLERRGLLVNKATACAQVKNIVVLVLGWTIIALSAVLGARFWFDLLSKLNTLRSSGPKPETTT